LRIANILEKKSRLNYLAFVDDDYNFFLIEKILKEFNLNINPNIIDPLKHNWLEKNNQKYLYDFFKKLKKLEHLIEDKEKWKLCAPVKFPNKIIAIGRNYMDHLEEGKRIWKNKGVNVSLPKFPSAFSKYSSSICDPFDKIIIPKNCTTLDYEIELAIIIGSNALNISENDSMDIIAGYTICNDLSARAIQMEEMTTQIGINLSKNFPTFAPMGPWFTSTLSINNPQNLNLNLSVNGKERQNANTRDMIFTIPAIISHWSKIGLKTGDIIITGTPSGVAIARPDPNSYYLKNGDKVICEIENLGKLENIVD
tara:strand:+ start:9024 stop:9956 length:933 start_codon:yes stop_codon:yes gene_type:complete